jgi:hypothetical protein
VRILNWSLTTQTEEGNRDSGWTRLSTSISLIKEMRLNLSHWERKEVNEVKLLWTLLSTSISLIKEMRLHLSHWERKEVNEVKLLWTLLSTSISLIKEMRLHLSHWERKEVNKVKHMWTRPATYISLIKKSVWIYLTVKEKMLMLLWTRLSTFTVSPW